MEVNFLFGFHNLISSIEKHLFMYLDIYFFILRYFLNFGSVTISMKNFNYIDEYSN